MKIVIVVPRCYYCKIWGTISVNKFCKKFQESSIKTSLAMHTVLENSTWCC